MTALQPLPQFPVEIAAPDLDAWIPGNAGVPGFTTRDSGRPGPHVALVALMHGNEIAGAIALDRLLRAGLRPRRGRLTFGFANLAAFARFDPRQPTASRYVDEDLNRIWDAAVLDGPRRSSELDRAREMRPLIDEVDVLLDLHSMLWPSEPLILCGRTARGQALAIAIGQPALAVADRGHATGPRLIDYAPFIDPKSERAAVLVEAGQHWEAPSVAMTLAAIGGLLRATGLARETEPALPPRVPAAAPRFAEVTACISAASAEFAFVRPFRGGEVLARRGELVARDGEVEIRSPYDDCLLVMPSLRPSRGHTAVRLARFREPDGHIA